MFEKNIFPTLPVTVPTEAVIHQLFYETWQQLKLLNSQGPREKL